MINLIYVEMKKLKKSYIFYLMIVASLFVPVTMFLDYKGISKEDIPELIEGILMNINLLQQELLFTITFAVIIGYVFTSEFRNNTANVIYSYQVSKGKIFISKLITSYILIFSVYVANFIVVEILFFLLGGSKVSETVFMMQLKPSIAAFLSQLIVLPLTAFVASISKNIIIPAVYGVAFGVSSMMLTTLGVYMQFSPFTIPMLSYFYFSMGDPLDYVILGSVVPLTIIIGIVLDVIWVRKVEIM